MILGLGLDLFFISDVLQHFRYCMQASCYYAECFLPENTSYQFYLQVAAISFVQPKF